MPKAYAIGNMDIHDADAYAEYRKHTPGSIAEFGGTFLVRGGELESLEGDAPLPRVVVIEFPSMEKARAWYNSPGYQSIVGIRHGAAVGHLFLVEGA